MQQVKIEKVQSWKPAAVNGFMVPVSLDCACGHCGHLTNIQADAYVVQAETQSVSMRGRCIRCQAVSIIYLIMAKTVAQHNEGKRAEECWVHPGPEVRECRFAEGDLPEARVFRAYREAVDLFNAGMPSPSIGCCGRAIEGIAKLNFPGTPEGTIGKLFNYLQSKIKDIPEDFKPLLSPLVELGEALRIGRNTGSHFDTEREPTKELAGKVLDLTEFLIQYVYTLKSETSKVAEMIDSLGPDA